MPESSNYVLSTKWGSLRGHPCNALLYPIKNPVAQMYHGILFRSLAMTYSHMGNPHTTIGDVTFHFRVRDGVGWFHYSMVARQTGLLSVVLCHV